MHACMSHIHAEWNFRSVCHSSDRSNTEKITKLLLDKSSFNDEKSMQYCFIMARNE